MRTHGTAGREAAAAFVEEFCAAAMEAMRKKRKAMERRAKRAKTPRPFKVTGFAPPMAAAR